MTTHFFIFFLLLLQPIASFPQRQSLAKKNGKETQNGLSARLSFPPSVSSSVSTIEGEFILENQSDNPIRICSLAQGWRSYWGDGYEERFTPNSWHSDSPTLDQQIQGIVTIEPGKRYSFRMIIKAGQYTDLGGENKTLTVWAGYESDVEFGSKLKVWSGEIQARPVKILIEP